MSKEAKKEQPDSPVVAEESPKVLLTIDNEDRIDDFAVKAYKAMGYKTRLSDNMVMFYREMKVRKDRLQPGRLSPEALAFVAMLAELADNNLPLGAED